MISLSSKISIFIIIVISLVRCSEPFEPEIEEFDNLYVIDGILTQNSNKSYVNISKTYKYNEISDSLNKISNAVVSVIDENGIEKMMENTDEGKYEFIDKTDSFISALGYKLRVITIEGDTLESDYEILPEAIDIDNLYFTFNDNPEEKGISIRLNTFDPKDKIKYFAWEYTETWEFSVPFVSSNLYDCKVCYKYTSPAKFLIESAVSYPNNTIIGFPITFIDNSTNKLRIKYSVNIEQYTLTENTFQFLKTLKESVEETGSLFDKIPATLVGNIKNINNQNLPVLGNFQVSGISEDRLFIYYQDINNYMTVPTGFEHCQLEYLDQTSGRLDSLIGAGWIRMDSMFVGIDTLVGAVNRRECFDCKRNGTGEVPEFWNEGK